MSFKLCITLLARRQFYRLVPCHRWSGQKMVKSKWIGWGDYASLYRGLCLAWIDLSRVEEDCFAS